LVELLLNLGSEIHKQPEIPELEHPLASNQRVQNHFTELVLALEHYFQ